MIDFCLIINYYYNICIYVCLLSYLYGCTHPQSTIDNYYFNNTSTAATALLGILPYIILWSKYIYEIIRYIDSRGKRSRGRWKCTNFLTENSISRSTFKFIPIYYTLYSKRCALLSVQYYCWIYNATASGRILPYKEISRPPSGAVRDEEEPKGYYIIEINHVSKALIYILFITLLS